VTLSAVELVAAVRRGEVSARTATERALQRIEHVDASIGAFQEVRTLAAIREAREVDARPDKASLPLAGLRDQGQRAGQG
jgi:amidase